MAFLACAISFNVVEIVFGSKNIRYEGLTWKIWYNVFKAFKNLTYCEYLATNATCVIVKDSSIIFIDENAQNWTFSERGTFKALKKMYKSMQNNEFCLSRKFLDEK
jgi:hypothetical protein